jgi:hypothetical protein
MVRIDSAYPLKRHVKLLTVVAGVVTNAAVAFAAHHAAVGGASRDPAAAPRMRPACRLGRRRIVRGRRVASRFGAFSVFATPSSRLLRTVILAIAWWAAVAMLGHYLEPYNPLLEFAILNGIASSSALYMGLGRSAPVKRAVVLLAGLSAAIAWEATFGQWPDYYHPLVVAASNAVATLSACIAVRVIAGDFAPGRWSVRDLMVTTAAIAVLMACIGGLRAGSFLGRTDLLAVWCLQGLALAIVSVAVALPAWGRRPLLALLATPCAIALAIALGYVGDYWLVGNWRLLAGSLRWHASLAVVQAVAIGGPVWTLGTKK